jgi:hypothetical protein
MCFGTNGNSLFEATRAEVTFLQQQIQSLLETNLLPWQNLQQNTFLGAWANGLFMAGLEATYGRDFEEHKH